MHQFHLWVRSKRTERAGTWKEIWLTTFIAILFTVSKISNKFKCSVTGEWLTKIWHIHKIMFTLKGNEILTYCTKWMNLEEIMLSEISQSQKKKTVIPLI
jgi:hypothetical protein